MPALIPPIVLRTGGTAGLTYGNFCGTAPSVLLAQRRAVAPAAAPAAGTVGQNINMALILADGSPKGKVDPAFPAHAGPIVYMAKAVWHGWLSNQAMLSGTATALTKQTKAVDIAIRNVRERFGHRRV